MEDVFQAQQAVRVGDRNVLVDQLGISGFGIVTVDANTVSLAVLLGVCFTQPVDRVVPGGNHLSPGRLLGHRRHHIGIQGADDAVFHQVETVIVTEEDRISALAELPVLHVIGLGRIGDLVEYALLSTASQENQQELDQSQPE